MYPFRSGSCGQEELPLERKGVDMKRLLVAFLAAALFVGVVACKKDDKGTKKDGGTKPPAGDTEKKDDTTKKAS